MRIVPATDPGSERRMIRSVFVDWVSTAGAGAFEPEAGFGAADGWAQETISRTQSAGHRRTGAPPTITAVGWGASELASGAARRPRSTRRFPGCIGPD